MPVQAIYQSDGTTRFTSNVSIDGRVSFGSTVAMLNSNLSLTGAFKAASVQVPSGTSLAPTLAFTSEVSLGWYRSAASQMVLSYGQLATAQDGTNVAPAYTFLSDMSRGFYRSAASTIAITSGVTFDWFTNSVTWSWNTNANASGMTTGNLRIVFQPSGISLMYSSGKTSYVLGSSTQSAAQA